MNESTRLRALTLLRLIVELRGSDLPSNNVSLEIISEREPEELAAQLRELEGDGLIAWSDGKEQWVPTMRGLTLGMSLPAYEPGACLIDTRAECA